MTQALNFTIDTIQYPGIIKIVFADEKDFTLNDAQQLLELLKDICN